MNGNERNEKNQIFKYFLLGAQIIATNDFEVSQLDMRSLLIPTRSMRSLWKNLLRRKRIVTGVLHDRMILLVRIFPQRRKSPERPSFSLGTVTFLPQSGGRRIKRASGVKVVADLLNFTSFQSCLVLSAPSFLHSHSPNNSRIFLLVHRNDHLACHLN